ncbi:MAG: hypothetical protein WC378_20740 [Opitutaceae bacterium]|jgi:hypothetical protein
MAMFEETTDQMTPDIESVEPDAVPDEGRRWYNNLPKKEDPYSTATGRLAEMRRPKLTDLILPVATLAMAIKSKGPAALGPVANYARNRNDYMKQLEELAYKETATKKAEEEKNAWKSSLADVDFSTPEGRTQALNAAAKQSSPEDIMGYLERLATLEARKSGAYQMSDRARKAQEYEAIISMPDGPEKERAMDVWWAGAAPSILYQGSPQARTDRQDLAAASAQGGTTGRTLTEEALAPIIEKNKAGVAAATTAAQNVANTENRPLQVSQTTALADIAASIGQVRDMVSGLEDPKNPTGPVAYMRGLNPFDVEGQGVKQLIASTKQLVGKALEGGVLRKEDEAKYGKILPREYDTLPVARKKTQQLIDMLNNVYSAQRDSYKKAGFDVSQFPESVGGGEARPNVTQAEYETLPSGGTYWYNGKSFTKE